MKKYLYIALVMVISITLFTVFAQAINAAVLLSAPISVTFENPLKTDDMKELIENVAGFIFMMALIFAGIMVVVSAYYFITSAGDAQKIETAKKIILYTLIGLIIVFLSRAIVYMIVKV